VDSFAEIINKRIEEVVFIMEKAKVMLISYSGYPEDALWSHLDNGLSLLAGTLVQNGHSVKVYDLQTLDTWEELFPYDYADEYVNLNKELYYYSLNWKQDDSQNEYLIDKLLEFDNKIDARNSKVINKITNQIIEREKAYSPDIIGFKLWAQNSIKDQINTAKQLKKAYPNAFLLGGGPFVYLFQEYILDMEDSNVFDLWDYGFGEDNILKIIECLKEQRDFSTIPGLIYKQNSKIVKRNREFPSLEKFFHYNYSPDIYYNMDSKMKCVHVEDSRGCNNHCDFCVHPGRSGCLNLKPVDIFLDELDVLNKQYGFSYFNLTGSNPPFNHIVNICKAAYERNRNYGFMAFHSLRYINNDDLNWLKRSNFDWFWIGVETGSQKITDDMTKARNLETLVENFNIIRENGITTTVSIIGPAPGEDVDTINDTINLLKKLHPDIARVYAPVIEPYTPWFNSTHDNIIVKDQAKIMKAYMEHGIEWHSGNRLLPHVFHSEEIGSGILYNHRPFKEVYFANKLIENKVKNALRKEQYYNYIKSQSSPSIYKQLYFKTQILIDDAIQTGDFREAKKLLKEFNEVALCGKFI